MKRLNACKTVLAFFSTVFFIFSFFSCKSAPQGVDVDLLSLVDPDASVFFYIPAENYQSLLQGILEKNISGLSQKDNQRLSEHLKDIYVASGSRSNQFQIAASLSVPQFALNSALSEKNGWKKETSSQTHVPFPYFSSFYDSVQLAFPTSHTALVSYDVEKQLSYYERALDSYESHVDVFIPLDLDPAIYEYLSENQRTEIRFYAQKPQDLMRMLFGKSVNLSIRSVQGSIVKTPSGKEAGITIDVEIEDPRVIKAASQVFKLAIFPVAAKISIKGPNHILISDYTISWKELTSLLTR